MENDFVIQEPLSDHLQRLVDYYFFIDVPVTELTIEKESIIPFPRITFGYFFDHPFRVTNHAAGEAVKAEMVISRVSTDQITVEPLTDRVKIIGAHVRPYTLAYLTNENLSELPWLINTADLFRDRAASFKRKIHRCPTPATMFGEVERMFLNTLLIKDLRVITEAIDTIESHRGDITVARLAEQTGVSNRTLRNHFYRSVGCSPKEYLHLVKLK